MSSQRQRVLSDRIVLGVAALVSLTDGATRTREGQRGDDQRDDAHFALIRTPTKALGHMITRVASVAWIVRAMTGWKSLPVSFI